MSRRFCFALDLKGDSTLSAEYRKYHEKIWPDMIFDGATLLSYVSEFMTLLPGDVISTGTPAGVGLGMKPPLYLKSGDVVELGIEGLGESRQRVMNLSE
jgi:2,4-diketo-3-deoxy-L-fuconate hydrolase